MFHSKLIHPMKSLNRVFLILLFSIGILSSQVNAQDVSRHHYLQSRMYLSSLQPAIALTHIQAAIELDHTRSEYFLLRAFVWRQLDRSDLFLKDFQQAQSINPHIIPESFEAKENLPDIIWPSSIDENPFIVDPGEWERRMPQKIGVRLQSPLVF